MFKKKEFPKELKNTNELTSIKAILSLSTKDRSYSPENEVIVEIKGFRLFVDNQHIYIVNGSTEDLLIEYKSISIPAGVNVKILNQDSFTLYPGKNLDECKINFKKGTISGNNRALLVSPYFEWLQAPKNQNQRMSEFYRLPLDEEFGFRLPTAMRQLYPQYDSAYISSLMDSYKDQLRLLDICNNFLGDQFQSYR